MRSEILRGLVTYYWPETHIMGRRRSKWEFFRNQHEKGLTV
jgi:hypothetical protein